MQIPSAMRAIAIQSGQLVPIECPIPLPQQNQVLLEVKAAGINRPDILQRLGFYPPPPGASDLPGLEVAGVVKALGNGVTNLSLGDKVCALVTGGGYAEYCVASSALCLPIPSPLSFIEAAGIPETFFTVWSNVFDRGHLNKDETLLVHGGSSGIGVAAIQLAKAFGAKIIVTAGSAEKCRFCLGLGADAAINYRAQDFVKEIAVLCGNQGVNLILDMIGGDYFPRNLQCLATEGRLAQIAVQQNPKAEINLWTLMTKRLTLTGSTLRARDDGFKAKIADKLRQNVWPLFNSGQIKSVIYATFPLQEAAKAHALMESNQHMGKIILTVTS